MRLPTVKLRHKSKPLARIVNAHDYARDLAGWARDWTIVAERRGAADTAEMAFQVRQSEIEVARARDPAETVKRGDAKRAYRARASRQNVATRRKARPKAKAKPTPDPGK